MAYHSTQGTAHGRLDLLNQIKDFLVTTVGWILHDDHRPMPSPITSLNPSGNPAPRTSICSTGSPPVPADSRWPLSNTGMR